MPKQNKLPASGWTLNARGFTILELTLVIIIATGLFLIVGKRVRMFSFWQEEGFVRKFSETVSFLYHQAIVDQAFYRMEFDLGDPQNGITPAYRVGVMRLEDSSTSTPTGTLADPDAGTLSLEFAAFLSPAVDGEQSMIPPPSIPSLADPTPLPPGVVFDGITTMRGDERPRKGSRPYILFSPRGFSEFAVIHFKLSSGAPITVLVNPFTGNTEIFREYKDFQWNYGNKDRKKKSA